MREGSQKSQNMNLRGPTTEETEHTLFWKELEKGLRKIAINEQAIRAEIEKLRHTLSIKELSLPTNSEESKNEMGQIEEKVLEKAPRRSARVKGRS